MISGGFDGETLPRMTRVRAERIFVPQDDSGHGSEPTVTNADLKKAAENLRKITWSDPCADGRWSLTATVCKK